MRWQDKYLNMIAACLARPNKLSAWEQKFLSDTKALLNQGKFIGNNAMTMIEDIYERFS